MTSLGAEPAVTRSVITVGTGRPQPERAWLLTLLPSFPIVLLVLRVWFLARQDVETMALLLQSASPLGLVSALLVSLVWAGPALLLGIRVCYLLHRVSTGSDRSWLSRVGARTPAWTSVPASGLALLAWQLRFLPLLLLTVAVIVRLEREVPRFGPVQLGAAGLPGRVAVVQPTVLAVLAAWWLAPTVWAATTGGEPVTAALLVVPLLLVPLLPGALPPGFADRVLPLAAAALLLVLPVFVGQRYLRAPVLPHVALERAVDGRATGVEQVSLVSLDDTYTTVLDESGVRFVPTKEIATIALCSAVPTPPTSRLAAHGWGVERSVLAWMAPTRSELPVDPRCLGAPQTGQSTGDPTR
ncbi:MAG: hypothetical protein HY830_18445 [Actinobacteria bacterium]|nr:hypothetical protein [Actinomycetota bacterium]